MADHKTENKESKEKTMTPWEQHSAVISIPRYDYNAPSALLEHSHSGFLITCPIKREKSATKEAITILSKYVGSLGPDSSGSLEAVDENVDPKRRKLYTEEIDQEETTSSSKVKVNGEKGILSLVKLTRSGLLLFILPKNNSTDTSNIVSNIFRSLDSANQKPLNWCHRIFPIQATCILDEENLRRVVSKLVQQFVDNQQKTPIKFAVAYNRRGIDETELKPRKSNSKDTSTASIPLLDRITCFGLVGNVVKGIIADSIVDLKSPEFAVLIELLPLSGIPNGSPVVAVSVLSHELINTKPKLSIKALILDTKKK